MPYKHSNKYNRPPAKWNRVIIPATLLLVAFACTTNLSTRQEVFEYIHNPKHGLLQVIQ